MNDASLCEHLRKLETQLLDPKFRQDRSRVEALLDEGFYEFGSSGRVWTKAEILLLMANEENHEPLAIEEFRVRRICADAALVSYRAVGSSRSSLRSSFWKHHSSGWQMVFHQGTLVPDDSVPCN